MRVVKIQLHSQGCVISQILLTQQVMYVSRENKTNFFIVKYMYTLNKVYIYLYILYI